MRSDPPVSRAIAAVEGARIDGCQIPRSETVAFGADCSRTYSSCRRGLVVSF